MYGLKQSPCQWYKHFDSFVVNNDFIRSQFISFLYFKDLLSDKVVFLLLYVDDMLVVGPSYNVIENVKHLLKIEFDMKDFGPAKKILGISISRK